MKGTAIVYEVIEVRLLRRGDKVFLLQLATT
jgi:hypothetical protein